MWIIFTLTGLQPCHRVTWLTSPGWALGGGITAFLIRPFTFTQEDILKWIAQEIFSLPSLSGCLRHLFTLSLLHTCHFFLCAPTGLSGMLSLIVSSWGRLDSCKDRSLITLKVSNQTRVCTNQRVIYSLTVSFMRRCRTFGCVLFFTLSACSLFLSLQLFKRFFFFSFIEVCCGGEQEVNWHKRRRDSRQIFTK